jgi:hypothetical protein
MDVVSLLAQRPFAKLDRCVPPVLNIVTATIWLENAAAHAFSVNMTSSLAAVMAMCGNSIFGLFGRDLCRCAVVQNGECDARSRRTTSKVTVV